MSGFLVPGSCGGVGKRQGDELDEEIAEVVRAPVERGEEEQVEERLARIDVGRGAGDGYGKGGVGETGEGRGDLLALPSGGEQRVLDIGPGDAARERILDELEQGLGMAIVSPSVRGVVEESVLR